VDTGQAKHEGKMEDMDGGIGRIANKKDVGMGKYRYNCPIKRNTKKNLGGMPGRRGMQFGNPVAVHGNLGKLKKLG